jgi:hypothetical protein
MASATNPNKLNRQERELQVLELRKTGATFEDIARTLREASASGEIAGVPAKYSRQHAHTDCMNAIKRLNQETAEEIETVRRLELDRLDAMFEACWTLASRGDSSAQARCINIMNQRFNYIPGLRITAEEGRHHNPYKGREEETPVRGMKITEVFVKLSGVEEEHERNSNSDSGEEQEEHLPDDDKE